MFKSGYFSACGVQAFKIRYAPICAEVSFQGPSKILSEILKKRHLVRAVGQNLKIGTGEQKAAAERNVDYLDLDWAAVPDPYVRH